MMENFQTDNLNIMRGARPRILVITDPPPPRIFNAGGVMSTPGLKLFCTQAERIGFSQEDFVFITPCPPIPSEIDVSESKIAKYVAEYREEFVSALGTIMDGIKLVVPMGKVAGRQLAGKPVQITRARGTMTTHELTRGTPVLPLFSPSMVLRRPEIKDVFESDFQQIRALSDHNWSVAQFAASGKGQGYRWVFDLGFMLTDPPKAITLDIEGVGLDWMNGSYRILSVSITPKFGTSYLVPLDIDYYNDENLRGLSTIGTLTPRIVARLKFQLKQLLGNPNVIVGGHNLKFDIHVLRTIGVEVANWYADTMQLAFLVDENMQSKSLDDCTRRWVPEMAGYADEFNKKTDKSRMDLVPHDEMIQYAGGDTDATFRLMRILLKIAREDRRQWDTFIKVQMPTLRTFVEMEEAGVLINQDALAQLEVTLGVRERELYAELMAEVPAAILRKHEGKWSFSRAQFVTDILFTREGFDLTPRVFTKSTRKLGNDEKVPSASSKDHLPYFEHVPFVQKLMEYLKLSKMRSTYVGKASSEKITPVARLKSGRYPKRIDDVLLANGIDLGKRKQIVSRALRSRRRSILADDPRYLDIGKDRLAIDPDGGLSVITQTEPTGFWQYIKDSGRIHPSFLLHRTVTGRTASANPNAQNFPKRGPLAKAYRKIFVPTPGYVFIECDLSQAELRIAAWMAGEREMIRIYSSGGDIHSATAAAVMGVSEDQFNRGVKDQETKLYDVANAWPGSGQFLRSFGNNERLTVTVAQFCAFKRFQAKSVNFGFLYGMGWKKFRDFAKTDYGIEYTEEEAQQTRIAFFRKYPRLATWHTAMREFVRQHGYVRALHGALRRLPNIESDDELIQGDSERQAINSPVQRFASDLGIIALCRFVRDAPKELMRPVLFIHDANVIEAREDIAEEAAAALKFYMQTPPLHKWFGLQPPLPIVADVSIGHNLGEMHERPDIEAQQPSWYRSGEEAPTDDPAQIEAWRTKRRRGIVLED